MTFSEVTTTCPYCGTGCSVNLVVKDGSVIGTSPYFRSPVNEGRLCPKGTFCHQFIHSPERLKTPVIKKDGLFHEVSWDEAYEEIKNRLSGYSPDEIAVLTSARCLNEENYIAMKFARGVLKTRHLDHCARLCHSSTMVGLFRAFGNGAMTNSIRDISESDCIFCLGSNTFEQHPLIGRQIIKAKQNGATLIYADPRYTPTAIQADLFLQFYSGSDILILNSIMGEIIRNGNEDMEFIEKRTKCYNDLRKTVLQKRYLPDVASTLSGVSEEDLRKAAKLIGEAKSCSVLYAMGITQHVTGVDNVRAIANLMLLTGNLGRPGTGVNALRGQNNVQGACDVGCLPNYLPGYMPITDGASHRKLLKTWKITNGLCEPKNGYEITTLFEKLNNNTSDVKAMYLIGANPLVSEPNLTSVEEGIKKLETLIVQDIFFTETCQYADIVLPAACFAEKDGTQTNTERRVQRVRKAIEPPGDAKPDWVILCDLAKRFGYADQFSYNSVDEIFEEITKVVPQYSGMTYEKVSRPEGVFWPCEKAGDEGTPILFETSFDNPDGLGCFCPVEWKEPGELPDNNYPFMFTTGRIIWHWQSGTMTRRSKNLTDEVDEGYLEINNEDASVLGINDMDSIRVISRRGEITCRAHISRDIKKGMTFMPFHFIECAANRLTSDALDPVSKIPEYKTAAIRIEKVNR